MSFRSLLFTIALTAALAIASGPVNATTIEFSGARANVELPVDNSAEGQAYWYTQAVGTMAIGQTDTLNFVDSDPKSGSYHKYILSGYLAPHSKITFSLNSSGYRENSQSLYLLADYNYYAVDGITVAGGGDYYKGKLSVLDTHPNHESGYNQMTSTVNGISSSPLVMAAAQISTDDPTTMSAHINNQSGGALKFMAIISKPYDIRGPVPSASITYEVTATPLPAALPMFAISLAGLFGLRRRKNKTYQHITPQI